MLRLVVSTLSVQTFIFSYFAAGDSYKDTKSENSSFYVILV